jgi:ABC-type amino acid transport system permease subunit
MCQNSRPRITPPWRLVTALAFLVAYLAGVVLAFARHPVFGLLTYVAVFFIHPSSRWWGHGTIGSIRWAMISSVVTLLAVFVGSSKLTRPGKPFMSHGVMVLLAGVIAWMALQSFWAMSPDEHAEVLSYYVKFFVMLYAMYRCVQTEDHIRWILWTYVLGCFYFGLIAYFDYSGGRFEGFGGPGVNEANAAALTIVVGIFFGAALFLDGGLKTRVALVLLMPFIVNALVTTISRSGFLALAVGGLVFNLYSPPRWRGRVRALSVLALFGFVALTGPAYWDRMQSLKHAGEEKEQVGVDTGEDRIAMMEAQVRMFAVHPLGCGAMCSAVLSPQYLDAKYLADNGFGVKLRASHNTFLSMAVEHGVPGAIFYLGMLAWFWRAHRRIWTWCRNSQGLLPSLYPAIAAIVVGITIGDVFVSYVKFEIRYWVILLAAVMVSFWARREKEASATVPPPGDPTGDSRLDGTPAPAGVSVRTAGPKRRAVTQSRPIG